MQFPLISLERNVSRSSWRCSALKLISVPEMLEYGLLTWSQACYQVMEAQASWPFPPVKIHASLVKWVPGQLPVRRDSSSHSTSAHTFHCSDAVHVNPRFSCGVQSRKSPITPHPISMRRMQPLNIEGPFFRIHNQGEIVADHSPL